MNNLIFSIVLLFRIIKVTDTLTEFKKLYDFKVFNNIYIPIYFIYEVIKSFKVSL